MLKNEEEDEQAYGSAGGNGNHGHIPLATLSPKGERGENETNLGLEDGNEMTGITMRREQGEGDMDDGTAYNLMFDGEMLPIGTKVFPSKYHFGKRLWALLIGTILVLFLCALISVSVSSRSGTASKFFLSLGFVQFIIVLGVFLVLYLKEKRRYEEQVENGSWLEGIFVFATGDVVVRFSNVYGNVEMEFDSGTISHALGSDAEKVLEIAYTNFEGIKKTYKVKCSQMVDSPSDIAAYINARERDGAEL